jgi:DNA polymerase III epsilon subunit-like protein
MLNYYVIDTETTGLTPGHHEVVEISIIRCSDRHQLTKFIKAEHPDRSSPYALKITKKSMADLKVGESKEDVVSACNNFFNQDNKTPEHRCIVAHNAKFDKNFCHALWQSVNQEFPAVCWLDTMSLAKKWAKKNGINRPKLSLASVINFTGVMPVPGEHTAKADARNTYLVWKKNMDENIDYLTSIKRYPHIF